MNWGQSHRHKNMLVANDRGFLYLLTCSACWGQLCLELYCRTIPLAWRVSSHYPGCTSADKKGTTAVHKRNAWYFDKNGVYEMLKIYRIHNIALQIKFKKGNLSKFFFCLKDLRLHVDIFEVSSPHQSHLKTFNMRHFMFEFNFNFINFALIKTIRIYKKQNKQLYTHTFW